MAATLSRWSCLALRYTSRPPSRRKAQPTPFATRPLFHTSSLYRAENNTVEDSDASLKRPSHAPFRFSLNDLDDEERAAYKALSPTEQAQWREEAKQVHDYMTSPDIEQQLAGDVAQAANEVTEEMPHTEFSIPRIKPGLMAMGEIEEQDSGEDEEFEGDDITSLGHGELEQHREMREYARIAAWEMPMLSSTSSPETFVCEYPAAG